MKANSTEGLVCIILAAGLGTRMKSSIPKVLHKIFGKPMLLYAIESLGKLKPDKTILVVGKNKEQIAALVGNSFNVEYAVQREQKGTGHAVLSAVSHIKNIDKGAVLITNGDSPLISSDTLNRFLKLHRKSGNSVSLLSFIADDPASYGRVLRNPEGRPLRIVEEKDANEYEQAIKEVNSGVYAIEPHALPLLKDIKLNKIKGEYYLTDIIEIVNNRGLDAGAYCIGTEEEFLGINTREDLAKAHKYLIKKSIKTHQNRSVNFIEPTSVYIEPTVTIDAETLIYPNVYLQGSTKIGKRCTIYPNVRIIDSTIKNGAVIKDSTLIENSTIGTDAQVGPYAHIRPESIIGDSVKIGNFVEVKKSIVGKGTKAMHLSYLGDSIVGKGVNIGAGTITCNYDGKKKYKTVIEDGVFVGSDSQFVAPVKAGKGSYIGAGSTITKNVPAGSLAISRSSQKNIAGWVAKKGKKVI